MWPTEKKFANILTKQNKRWEYPTKRFTLSKGTYRPDFYLPEEDLYIEVVASLPAYRAHQKQIKELKELYPNVRLLIVDYKNNKYPDFLFIKNKERKWLIEIPQALHRELKAYSKATGLKIKHIATVAITDFLKKGAKVDRDWNQICVMAMAIVFLIAL